MLKQSHPHLISAVQLHSNEPPEHRGRGSCLALSRQLLQALKSLALLSALIPWGFTPPHLNFNLFFFL